MRIGELAELTGASVRALRYYEEQQLIAPVRSASRQRHYEEAAVDRVRLIRRLYSAGLSSSTIVELLPCVDHPGDSATARSVARMRAERQRIDAQIAELTRTRDTLDEVIDAAVACVTTAATA